MKTVQISLNSIDKVKSFVNDISKFGKKKNTGAEDFEEDYDDDYGSVTDEDDEA